MDKDRQKYSLYYKIIIVVLLVLIAAFSAYYYRYIYKTIPTTLPSMSGGNIKQLQLMNEIKNMISNNRF